MSVSGERGPKRSVCLDGDRLRDAREAADFTQQDLARQADTSLDSVKRAERGVAVAWKTARDICSALNIRSDEYLVLSKVPDPDPVHLSPSVPLFEDVPPAELRAKDDPPAADPGPGKIFPGVPLQVTHLADRRDELARLHVLLMGRGTT